MKIIKISDNLVTKGSSPDLLFSSERENTIKDTTTDSYKEYSIKSVAEKDKEYVCGDNKVNSNHFITEFVLPFPCSQPLGLAVDKDNNIWIAANWIGRFLVFETSTNTFVKNISIPIKDPETTFGSIWELKFDKNGDLWFTDQRSNSIWRYFVTEDKFERYKTHPPASYPM